VLGLLVELLFQRSIPLEDRDLTIVDQLLDELARGSSPSAALGELALAAVGSLELAGEALQEDPAELLRMGAVSAGWIEGWRA